MRAILTYHSIDESGSPISISEQVFRSQIAWLAKGHVKVVSLETLMGMPASANAVALIPRDQRNLPAREEVTVHLLRDDGIMTES